MKTLTRASHYYDTPIPPVTVAAAVLQTVHRCKLNFSEHKSAEQLISTFRPLDQQAQRSDTSRGYMSSYGRQ